MKCNALFLDDIFASTRKSCAVASYLYEAWLRAVFLLLLLVMLAFGLAIPLSV